MTQDHAQIAVNHHLRAAARTIDIKRARIVLRHGAILRPSAAARVLPLRLRRRFFKLRSWFEPHSTNKKGAACRMRRLLYPEFSQVTLWPASRLLPARESAVVPGARSSSAPWSAAAARLAVSEAVSPAKAYLRSRASVRSRPALRVQAKRWPRALRRRDW